MLRTVQDRWGIGVGLEGKGSDICTRANEQQDDRQKTGEVKQRRLHGEQEKSSGGRLSKTQGGSTRVKDERRNNA